MCDLKVQGLGKFWTPALPKPWELRCFMHSNSRRGFIVYSDLCRRQQHRLSVFHIILASILSFISGFASCFGWLLVIDYDSNYTAAEPLCHSDFVTSESLGTSPFHGWTGSLFRSWRVHIPLDNGGPGSGTFGFSDFLVLPFSGFPSPRYHLYL